VSHSVHLKPRPPTRGLSLRAARRTTGRPLAPPHRRVSPPQTGSQFWISCDIWLSFAVMLQRKAPPLAGCEGRG
jgi:hypothetical protein